MLEYMIGTTRRNGKSLRYLRIKSDAEIGLTGDLVTFTQTQEDKVSVYEVIVGDLLREESGDGLFYRWYEVESVLVETDHTPQPRHFGKSATLRGPSRLKLSNER